MRGSRDSPIGDRLLVVLAVRRSALYRRLVDQPGVGHRLRTTSVCVVDPRARRALSWFDGGGTRVILTATICGLPLQVATCRPSSTNVAAIGDLHHAGTDHHHIVAPCFTFAGRLDEHYHHVEYDDHERANHDHVAAASTSSTTTTTTTTTAPPTVNRLLVRPRIGSVVTLQWLDEGGTHVLRRNGRWLATPGRDTSSYVDESSPAGASYVVRTWLASKSTDRSCVFEQEPPPPPPPPPPPADRTADRVIHVGIDGLRADHVTPELMPNLIRLMGEGASTLNARTDPAYTQTLPNHHFAVHRSSRVWDRRSPGRLQQRLRHHGPHRSRYLCVVGVRRRSRSRWLDAAVRRQVEVRHDRPELERDPRCILDLVGDDDGATRLTPTIGWHPRWQSDPLVQ